MFEPSDQAKAERCEQLTATKLTPRQSLQTQQIQTGTSTVEHQVKPRQQPGASSSKLQVATFRRVQPPLQAQTSEMYPALKNDIPEGGIPENFQEFDLKKGPQKAYSDFNQSHAQYVACEDKRGQPSTFLSGVRSDS